MNPITSVKTIIVASSLALGTAVTGICNAAEPAVTVSYRDLAVSTAEGASMLYRRIRFAADAVCSYLDHGDLASKAHKSACAEKAIADAVIRVNQPQLFSVYNATHATSLPTTVASR